jgi:membrane protein GlpM
MSLLIKAIIGAAFVVAIDLLSRTRNFYIAGLLPLFPTFSLTAHYLVGSQRNPADLKTTVVFGFWAAIPYIAYLVSVFALAERMKLLWTLALSVVVWVIVALILVVMWEKRWLPGA